MITLVIPVYNEEHVLESHISILSKAMMSVARDDYEIVIFEDGSTDGTRAIARKLARTAPHVRIMEAPERIGRGVSLAMAFSGAKGDIVVYLDADLAADLSHLPALIWEIQSGADVCTGSRLLPGSKVAGRNYIRDVASRGYNLLLRLLFNTKILDHQCGFKAFRKSAILPLLSQIRDTHWFWDSELLIRAQNAGLKVTEIPISWTDRRDSRVRLWSDVPYMGFAALRLRFSL